ncbi:MAG TPA: DNA gyrase subunit A [Candidatus Levybacteria bacterium]|nr:DNA gyrase subunit A [Candidatus Levybacteria bacterium]
MEDIGRLEQVDISQEAKKSYLDYAMSVIVSRALPDIRDGLKPVHRRILYAMYKDLGLTHDHKYSKCAGVVGEVLKKYHPHGDMAVYDAMVRLAQEWNLRYPLIDGQGNFGSIDGDSPAAYRYTEARLTKIAEELLRDYQKETVDFTPNFDGSEDQPVVLPALLPNLLLMGSEGIAVGMATKIPPHNLTEVVEAILYTMGKAEKIEGVQPVADNDNTATNDTSENILNTGEVVFPFTFNTTIDELLEFIKGPDFPTGGAIFDQNEIKNVYRTGRGRVLMRGIAEIEELSGGKNAIIIRELPYQVNKAVLVARIAELAKDKKLDGISDLRDESDRAGIRVVVELKRDVAPRKVLNNLFKLTALQTSFPANMVALVNGIPRTCNLKLILEEYIKHRFDVVTRRSQFELRQAQARLHILDGLLIAVNDIDAVIQLIRSSKSADEARTNLMEKYKLSEIQAIAILDMQLRRLAALERQKLEEEWKSVKAVIDYLLSILGDPLKMIAVIKEEIEKIKEEYGDERRTRVYNSKADEFSDEDLIQNEPTVITITKTGYVKRQSMTSFKTQKRGGKGVMGMTTKDDDSIDHILFSQTHDYILFFTDKGKVYQTRVFEIPESSRIAKGQAIANLLNTESGETISSILTYNPQQKENKEFVMLATRKGEVKKTNLKEFANIRKNGIIAIKIASDDSLTWARFTSGSDEVLLVTANGKIICFNESQIRATGRSSMGVRGIKLIGNDRVVGVDVISESEKSANLLVIAENGLGKKTRVDAFKNQNRGGQGVRVANINEKTGQIVYSAVLPQDGKEIIMTSEKGQVVKIDIQSIPLLSRNAQGVILMRFSKSNDKVAAATCVTEKDEVGE